MAPMNLYKKSLELHKKHRGKLEVKLKTPIKNKKDLSLTYTPGVAGVSRFIAKNPKSVYDHTIKGNAVAVVTDGSAILGLGDLGPEAALPVMEGKAALFKQFANIDAFPICLDTKDPDKIIEIVKHISPVFGAVNLEDISAPKCFYIEEKLRKEAKIPVMHDDQHGAAVVVLAGLINALKLRQSKKGRVKIVVNGAGAAGVAITKLLIKYGFREIIICDSMGTIYKGRKNLNTEKQKLANLTNPKRTQGLLADVLVGADIFIGVSKGGLLTGQMVKTMNQKPIIFALANPDPEITPVEAKRAGAFVVATGRSDYPNQVNNSLVFPGVFRGALDNKIKQFKEWMFIKAALALAGCVKNPSPNKIIPGPFDKGVVEKIAKIIR